MYCVFFQNLSGYKVFKDLNDLNDFKDFKDFKDSLRLKNEGNAHRCGCLHFRPLTYGG